MRLGGGRSEQGRAGLPLPLSNRPLFASRDLDEAREKVAQVYCDHRLERIGSGSFDACHNRLSGRHLSINVMTYGGKTLIAPGELGQFYLFQFPIRGHASVNNGTNQHDIGGGLSGVLNPDEDTCMIWSENCAQVMVQVERDALTRTARSHFGVPADRLLRFAGANDMRGGDGRAFVELLGYAIQQAELGGVPIGGDSLMAQQLETTLMVGLLQTQRHCFSGLAQADAKSSVAGPVPRIVRVAEGYMSSHLKSALTLEDIAREAGASVRALQAAFRASRGRSPMTVLRDMRMERAWVDLSHPTPETNVTEVATGLGFFHLGRFAEQYRKKYGCTPIETLRSARMQ